VSVVQANKHNFVFVRLIDVGVGREKKNINESHGIALFQKAASPSPPTRRSEEQRERERERERDRQTDRQTDRHTHTHTHRERERERERERAHAFVYLDVCTRVRKNQCRVHDTGGVPESSIHCDLYLTNQAFVACLFLAEDLTKSDSPTLLP